MSDQATPVEFAADNNHALPRLLVRNMVFGFLTLGFYRFWAKTALRRHFWARIAVADEPFEYIGIGRELFIGFLIVMAAFMPLSIGYSVLQTAVLDSPATIMVLSAAYSIAMFVLTFAATYRARRYRLSRTVWRGVRAGQDGSTWRYVGLAAAWAVPVVLTAGLALPWGAAALARYRMDHTYWGSFRGSFTGIGRQLFAAWLPFWGIGVIGVILLSMVLPDTEMHREMAEEDPVFAYVMIGLIGFAVGYLLFQARWLRWYASHAALGPLRFSCTLRLRNVILYAVPAVLLPAIFVAVMVAVGYMAIDLLLKIGVVAAIAGGAILVMAIWGGLRILFTLTVYVPILRHIVTSILISHLDAASGAAQSENLPQRFGEGLADSFEIGIA